MHRNILLEMEAKLFRNPRRTIDISMVGREDMTVNQAVLAKKWRYVTLT